MTGQASVLINMASGVVGDLALDGPHRAQPGIITNSGGGAVGLVYTQVAGQDGECILGGVPGNGTPVFGILANPKVYALFGSGSPPISPSLVIPQYGKGEFVYDTTGIWVSLPAAANVGDKVDFNTTTGAIVTRAPTVSVTGALAASAGSGALNVLTVSAVTAGSPPIIPGTTVLDIPGVGPINVVAQLTGTTGGIGTYSVQCNLLASSSSGLITGESGPASGNANVPGFVVVRYNIPSAGLGMIGNIN